MTVAVICTFLNAQDTLAATLDSLRAQTTLDAQFILVDDGSSDLSATIAARYCGGDRRFFSCANPNPGRIRALNLAVSGTDADLIAILDADDVAHPTWLEDGLTAMQEMPRYAAIGCERLFLHGLAEPDWPEEPPALEVRDVTHELAHGNVIGHSGALIRKARLDQLGGYDEQLSNLEDYDLWIRLAVTGHAIGRSNLVRIAKRYHKGQHFGRLPRASLGMRLRAVRSIDPSLANMLSLALAGVKEIARQPLRWRSRY